MTYFYANDWTLNTDELLNSVPALVDLASKRNCSLYHTPIFMSDGYSTQRFLLNAPQLEEANQYIVDSAKLLKDVNWMPIAEGDFQENIIEDGHPRPSLNKLKLQATSNFNLWKLIDIWYPFAVQNDQLNKSLDK